MIRMNRCAWAKFLPVVVLVSSAWNPNVFSAEPIPAAANIFVRLAKKSVPSVVNISTTAGAKNSPLRRGSPQDLFRRFFEEYLGRGGSPDGGEEADMGPRAVSLGTGFIVESSGLILTNNHVVVGADEIKIYFTEDEDEKPTDGEVVGRDPELDLALIRVKTKRALTALPLGDSDALEVGEYVMAVGNPFGQGHSVTHGIISAKGRKSPDFTLAKYIQTDAPINPGNSGGPLLNLKGEVIAINNAIDARAQGIGFAIPINQVKAVLPQLKSKGSVSRGYIGVVVNDLSPEISQKLSLPKDLQSPVVAHVNPDEPAAKAGVQPYDIVLEFNRKPIKTSTDLILEVTRVPVGESVPLKIMRGKDTQTLMIKVGQRPTTPEIARNEGRPARKKIIPSVDVGMEISDLTPDLLAELGMDPKATGIVVEELEYGGAADRAGLARGDVIVEADRKPIKSVADFFRIVKERKAYLLRVRRSDAQGRESFSVVVLDLKK